MSVKFTNVCFSYPEKSALLENLTLEAKNGRITAIVGNNATGKSTIAKLACGLLKPVSGGIESDGPVALVMQNPEAQIFEKTVIKEVMFGNNRESAETALKRVGLDESFFEKDPFKLSGGQQRKVAIAGIIALNRQTIIFDESAAGLDYRGLSLYLKILQEEKEKGHAVITITHNPQEIALADRLYRF